MNNSRNFPPPPPDVLYETQMIKFGVDMDKLALKDQLLGNQHEVKAAESEATLDHLLQNLLSELGGDQPAPPQPQRDSVEYTQYTQGTPEYTQYTQGTPASGNGDETIWGHENGNLQIVGVCAKCEATVSSGTLYYEKGDNLLHKQCFSCDECGACLQSESYYVCNTEVKCEQCFSKIDFCGSCNRIIRNQMTRLGERSYHAACLVCCVCRVSLANSTATVDRLQRVFCAPCFYLSKTVPCQSCGSLIKPVESSGEIVSIKRNNRFYHPHCYLV